MTPKVQSHARPPQPRKVKLPHHRFRACSATLLSLYCLPPPAPLHLNQIKVICISDTHGNQPPIPPGDLLVHAGDLTEVGTFLKNPSTARLARCATAQVQGRHCWQP